MPAYSKFYPEITKIIMDALRFIRKKIEDYFSEQRKNTDESFYPLINTEHANELDRLTKAINFLQENATGTGVFEIDTKNYQSFINIVRSALEVYKQEMLKSKAETGLDGFEEKIQEIKRIVNLDSLQKGKTDLFSKYYPFKVFISYAHEDRVLAGKIANLLNEKEIDAFLAHENIEISEEWRNEILKHLENANFLLALLTDNYEKSVWANQEAGYIMGKRGKNIPLIVGKTNIKKFGFLESFQGVPVTEENLKDCVEKIVSIILK